MSSILAIPVLVQEICARVVYVHESEKAEFRKKHVLFLILYFGYVRLKVFFFFILALAYHLSPTKIRKMQIVRKGGTLN